MKRTFFFFISEGWRSLIIWRTEGLHATNGFFPKGAAAIDKLLVYQCHFCDARMGRARAAIGQLEANVKVWLVGELGLEFSWFHKSCQLRRTSFHSWPHDGTVGGDHL